MTLHEIATGVRARWQGGQPRLTDEQITLRVEVCDPNLRDQFTKFFRTALHRDYRQRFDNTQEMLQAWNGIFETVDRPTTAHSEHEPTADAISDAALSTATLDTPVPLLGLSTRLLNVLDRLGVHTVNELLQFSGPGQFNKFRGVGRKTQREFFSAIHKLRLKFPKAGATPTLVAPVDASALGNETVDTLAQHALLVKQGKAGETEAGILHPFLGWNVPATADPLVWPSQSDLVAVCAVTRQRIGQIITAARERWEKSPLLAGLREAIAETLSTRGGVMTQRELVATVLAARGSSAEEPQRTQLASAAVRSAVEAEHISDQPRFEEYRTGDKIFLALHPALRDYAVALGHETDRLAALDPLAGPARVVEELRAVRFPEEVPDLVSPSEARVRQLAVSAATQADLSSRGEIYPVGLAAGRALALARNALFGDLLTVAEIERRLRARFPAAARCRPARSLMTCSTTPASSWIGTRSPRMAKGLTNPAAPRRSPSPIRPARGNSRVIHFSPPRSTTPRLSRLQPSKTASAIPSPKAATSSSRSNPPSSNAPARNSPLASTSTLATSTTSSSKTSAPKPTAWARAGKSC